MLLEDVKAEFLVEYLLIFFIAFAGSFVKYGLFVYKGLSNKISIITILLSAITASFVVFAASPYIQEHLGIRGLMVISFFIGLVGFQLLERLSTLEGMMDFMRDVLDLYDRKRDKREP